jgi:pyruvate dehydrogenase E1 component alpha subunit
MVPFSYRSPDASGRHEALDLPAERLLGLYRDMLRIRMIELEIERRYSEDEMKTPVHLVIGQEATAVGLCAALERTDRIYTSHRTHGGYLAKGGDLRAMMSELYGRANGCAGSRGGSMHLVDFDAGVAGSSAIVSGVVPIAAGSALASQLQGDGRVTAVMVGEAANEEGVLWETVNFAALKRLPLVFFCENNYYSVCTPLSERQAGRLSERAALQMPYIKVDGTRVLDVLGATREAVSRARRGEGPSYLEAEVYRWRGHSGAGEDFALGYRSAEELEEWKAHCPVEGFAEALRERDLLNSKLETSMRAEIESEIAGAFQHARMSAFPTEGELGKHVYSHL